MPITPEAAPWTMKMPITERGVAPSVRRMAMSARLSVTVITSVDTRLNAATATISVRMIESRRFWICTEANQLRLVSVQSRTTTRGPSACSSSAATSGACSRSFRRRRRPFGPASWNSLIASSRCTSARPLSYSKWPASKVPATVSVPMRGTTPAALRSAARAGSG